MFLLKSKSSLLLLCILFLNCLHAQVAIGTANTPADQSAMLDVQSTSKGLLFPRLTSAQRRAISSPTAGLVVYDTEKQSLYLYNGSIWKALAMTDVSMAPTSTATGIEPADGVMGDGLGNNVKIYGNYAVVGSYADDIGANTDQGSAYIYKFENGAWTQMQKITANDGEAGDGFGGGFALDSLFLIIGAYNDNVGENIDQGSVYFFKLENGVWTQKQKLTGSNGASGDIFGVNISMSKGYAVVGASKDDIGSATDAGSAYIFKLNETTGSWSEIQKIYPPDVSSGDNFGNWVSLDGDKILVTSIYDDANGVYRKGSAYIFTRQAGIWNQTAKIVANDGAYNDNFGTNASIQGDFVLVGAYNADASFTNQGACYLFKLENNLWVQKQKIVANDANTNGFFGQTASLRDNYAIIGAHGVNSLQGAAYLFQLNPLSSTMTQVQKITAIDAVSNDYFGWSTDINKDFIIIGAFGKNSSKGKVYFKSFE
jgi:FG-GAP repeat